MKDPWQVMTDRAAPILRLEFLLPLVLYAVSTKSRKQRQQPRTGPACVDIGDDTGRLARGFYVGQDVAGRAAIRIVLNNDGHDEPFPEGNQC